MAKQYISVDASTKKTNQQVEMENVNNVFTGQFLLPNGTTRTDIRDTFISDIEVDGELAEVDENKGQSGGKKVNLNVRPTKVFETQDQKDQFLRTNAAKEGQLVAVKNGDSADVYVIVEDSGTKKAIHLNPVRSVTLAGELGGEIDAKITNGNARIQLDELEFDEIHVNDLYLRGTSIFNILQEVGPAVKFEPEPTLDYTMDELRTAHNDLVDKFNALLEALSVITQKTT